MEATKLAQVAMDIVDVEGRTIEGVKVMGLLPESAYANGEDFNIYVRWDVEYGAVRATRSDTDEQIITVGLTGRKAKGAAFAELMQALANHYGLTVVVQADPGIKGAHAIKLCGTWAPEVTVADIPIPQADQVHACSIAGCKTGQAPVMLLKIATGPSARYTNDVYFCAVCWPWYEHSTELGNVVESISLMDASDIAEGNAQDWAQAGSPRNAAGQPDVSALPIRTPGQAAWEIFEAEIWAGTDMVEPMRRSRLSRKGKRALEKAFREGCCGRADHERWCRTWRPITKRHAARMGIDRKDAVLLRPRFADLLAVRVGK